MKKLIVSATKQEVNKILSENNFSKSKEVDNLFEGEELDILISGIGSAFTIFNLTRLLQNKVYSEVINIGIAGTYNDNISLGELVFIEQDLFADLGIDDNGVFKTLEEEGILNQENIFYSSKDILELPYKKVKAITVNTASGSEEKIKLWKQKFNPDIETMEGAAVYFVCNKMNIPVMQVRAISNYVEPRNKENWDIKKALNSLKDFTNSNLNPKI